MHTRDIAAVNSELAYAHDRVSWAGQGRRRNVDWIDALERIIDAAEAADESQAAALRCEAAVRAAEALATANAWQVVAAYVECLADDDWADAVGIPVIPDDMDDDDDDDEPVARRGESLAEWAARHRGVEVPLKHGGEDGFQVSDDGTAVTVWAAVVSVGADWVEPVVATIPIDQLDSWEPPEVPGPDRRDLALLGELDEHELLDLARSADLDDQIAAICSPEVTAEVLRAAGADITVDVRDGEVEVRGLRRRITIGRLDLDADVDEIADQMLDLVPGVSVEIRSIEIDPDTGDVDLYLDGKPIRTLGTIDLTDDEDVDQDAATDLARDYIRGWAYEMEWRDGRLVVDVTVTP